MNPTPPGWWRGLRGGRDDPGNVPVDIGWVSVVGGRDTESVLIRRETAADIDAIDAVHQAAFDRAATDTEPPEAQLVRLLRADIGWVPALSLVAEHPAEGVVGHVVCTAGSIDDDVALGLGPLGVLPARQRGGVGQALMHAVLGAADALGFAVVVLIGRVDYYARFGFVAARSIGVLPPDPGWDHHFQARPLQAWHPTIGGVFKYATPFNDLGLSGQPR